MLRNLKFGKPFFAFDEDPNGGGAPGAGEADKGANEEKKFTQAELDQHIKDRLAQAKGSYDKNLRKDLGLAEDEDAKALIEAGRQAKIDKMSADEKNQQAVTEAVKRAEAAEAERDALSKRERETRMRSLVEREATSANFLPEAVSDVFMVADLSKVTEKEDGTFEGIKEAVEAVAKSKPHWLKKNNGNGTPPPRNGGNPPKAPEKNESDTGTPPIKFSFNP